MRNTGILYSSTERTPVVLPELAELLPPLNGEQLAALEADLLQNGCYSPIIVAEDMAIVDGHNRQRLCEKHGLPYQMAVFAFESLLEAKQWALDTQRGRRNLDKWELGKIALKLKPEIEAKARENMSAGGGDQKSEEAKSGSAILPNPILPPHFSDRRRPLTYSLLPWPQFPVSASGQSYPAPTCPGFAGPAGYPGPIALLPGDFQMQTPPSGRAGHVSHTASGGCGHPRWPCPPRQ